MNPPDDRHVLIIGAGPAGLTAAYELLAGGVRQVTVVERDDLVGGISRTINHNGNRMDIGGHRFFTKSDRVMDWWKRFLPIQDLTHTDLADGLTTRYQNRTSTIDLDDGPGPDPETEDRVMLVRPRKSRILFAGRFFDYPLSLNARTLRKLGLTTTIRVGLSYLKSLIVKRKPERTLEDFIVNRFGRVLYSMFFEAYTEKVWGVPCTRIPADWGAQRIKGVSISSLLRHALRRLWPQRASIEQKEVETSLIERFLYPKLGPGQMWEVVRDEVERLGGTVLLNHEVRAVYHDESGVRAVSVVPTAGGERRMAVDVLVSTTDVKHLVAGLEPPPPPRIRSIAGDLPYRDFITVGVLLKGLRNPEEEEGQGIEDNWIYVQEPSVRVGRIQFFKNWSPYMVADRDTEWLGLEYFCNEGDDLWSLGDAEFARMAVDELARIGLARPEDLLDTHVVRYRKTYPAYFGSYREFAVVRDHLDGIANLFLVGRNGMHRYNNQDHSMLTAMLAAERIIAGSQQRSDLWDVNTEQSYHETR